MSNLILLPSLSEDGWLNTSERIADYMLAHFFLSEKSQTYLYGAQVASLQYIIQNNADSMMNTAIETKTTLYSYFARYFTSVEVECSVNDITTNGSSANLNIYVGFTDSDGKTFSVGKLVNILNSKVNSFITLNNG